MGILTLLDSAKDVASSTGEFVDGLAHLANKAETATNYYKDQSLAQFAKLTQVEPVAVVSSDLINLAYMPDVMQSALSVFTGYYLQAVNILAPGIKSQAIRTLDSLNPDRDASGFLALATEEQASRMYYRENYSYSFPAVNRISAEDVSTTSNSYQILKESANLAVGRMIEVEFSSPETDHNGKKTKLTRKVEVRVRIAPVVLPVKAVEKIIAFKTEDETLIERYHAWRAGRISFIKDLIFCQDLIDAHKKALMHDEAGVFSELTRRNLNAKKYGLLTANPSLSSASSIFVISEETAKEIERKFGGSLSKKAVLDKVFQNTYGMLLIVVDREYERVIFYTRGIQGSADFGIKEIQHANKGKGIDIQDIFKTFTMGHTPSF